MAQKFLPVVSVFSAKRLADIMVIGRFCSTADHHPNYCAPHDKPRRTSGPHA